MNKITLSLISAMLLSATGVFAASISFSNTNSAFDNYQSIVSSTGDRITLGTGSVSIGYFTGSDATISGGDFSSFSSFASGNMNGGGFDLDGMYNIGGSGSIATGSPFVGQNIYTFIEADSEYLVVKSATTFAVDAPVFNAAIDIASEGTLLFGSVGPLVTFGFGDAPAASFQLVAVPEPSAYALLGGLLALGCVMLRRRA